MARDEISDRLNYDWHLIIIFNITSDLCSNCSYDVLASNFAKRDKNVKDQWYQRQLTLVKSYLQKNSFRDHSNRLRETRDRRQKKTNRRKQKRAVDIGANNPRSSYEVVFSHLNINNNQIN